MEIVAATWLRLVAAFLISAGLKRRGVAQLAERRSPKPKVGGSRPSAPATD